MKNIKKAFSKVYKSILLISAEISLINSLRIRCLKMAGYSIGSNTYIARGLIILDNRGKNEETVEIGNNVSFGPRTILIPGAYHNSIQTGFEKFGKIVIDNEAWIGAGVIILPGIKVGARSIVGAGSVVTKNVPPNTVVAGVPARVLKKITK
jgi:maltose O-acetyltransferase